MRHARVMGLAGLAVLAVGAVAFAQTTVVPVPDNAPVETAPLDINLAKTTWGDAKAGQTKAAACAACHGADGNPSDPQYPRLAGQSERYIAQQLALFASGERNTGMAAVMAPFAQTLNAQDMRDVGAYFATQKSGAGLADDSVVADGPYQGMKFYEVGQQLYRNGDAKRGVPACMACHGAVGHGNPGPPYPAIAGQHAGYTAAQLQAFRAGIVYGRGPNANSVMVGVAKYLTDEEIQSLATYVQGLHPAAGEAVATTP
jgi:cytochrome c553